MNYTNSIDSCQAQLPLQYASNIELARSETGVVIDSEPQLSRTCKTCLLFAPLDVRGQADYSAFPFYAPTEPLIRLYFKYKTVLVPKLKIILYFGYL